jgi:hypothetical protein
MPTKLKNVNFLMFHNRGCPFRGYCASVGFSGATFESCLLPLSGEVPARCAKPTTNVVGSSKEQPQNSAQQAHDQYRQKDEVPRACAGRSGQIDLRSGAAKHKAEALGVIIKDQNVLHSPAFSRTCRWQLHRLLNDKKSFRPHAKTPTKTKKAKRIGRTTFRRQSKERRIECSGPVMRAPSFHSPR